MKYFLLSVIFSGLLMSCTTHYPQVDKREVMKREGFVNSHAGYGIVLPEGWKEITDENQVKRRLFWAFDIGRFTAWEAKPIVNAFDSPESVDTILTSISLKVDRSSGLGNWYHEVMHFMKEFGFKVQEQGTTAIGGKRAKWWVTSIAEGSFHQMCFMTMHADGLYIFYFTTPYLSEEKMRYYENMTKSIVF